MAQHSISDPSNPLFQTIRTAARKRIRLGGLEGAQRLGQNIRSAGGTGIRTSGVSLIPQIEAGRRRSTAEASLEERLATSQLTQAGGLETLRERAGLREKAAVSRFGRQRNFAREQARARLQQALISGAFQLPASFLGGFGRGIGGK